MAKVVDPHDLPDPKARIPGLKPPVLDSSGAMVATRLKQTCSIG
jgi:hypothetical protein